MVPSENKTVEFEVVDEQGQVIKPNVPPVLTEEELRVQERDQLRFVKRFMKMQAQKRENARAQKARTKKSRKKRELQKASRKRNRK